MKNEKARVKDGAEEMGKKFLDPEFLKQARGVIDDVLKKGMPPKEALKMTDEKMEAIYAQAYRLYNAGKFQDAANVFRLLMFLDGTQSRFPMGFAACAHMMKDYDAAIKMYTYCSIVDVNDPLPAFHASDCYIEKNEPAAALVMLEMAVARAQNRPEFQVLKDRAQMTINSLRKDLQLVEPSK